MVYPVLLALATAGMVLGHFLVFDYAPVEAHMGVVQKIFYYHVTSAWACYLGFLLCFGGSLVYLWKRRPKADAFALASAEVGLIFGAIVLTTGPLWARAAWGVWWKWEPRLTTMALLVMMYAAYWVLRTFGGEGEGVRRFAGALGIFAAPNMYFVHIAVQKWRGQHPQLQKGAGLAPEMKLTMWAALAAVLLLFGLLLALRYRAHLQARTVRAFRRRLARVGA